jgi:hypothetical protein
MADRLDKLHNEHLAYLIKRWNGCFGVADHLIGHRPNEGGDDIDVRARCVFELSILLFSFSAMHFNEFFGVAEAGRNVRGLGS